MPSQHSSPFDYNIANLLNDVKDKFKDTFSEDVYQHFNTVREENSFSNGLRYQLKNSDIDDTTTRAESFFGTTYNWKETGYILTNGKRLDFSGKKDGAPAGHTLANSIEVNQLNSRGDIDVPYSHVMLGVTGVEQQNGTIQYYVVRMVVEERENQNPILLSGIKCVGTSLCCKCKKREPAGRSSPRCSRI